ncbi:MAG: hypothetical protein RL291_1761 [Pseudomonadota bacterium]
MRELVKTNDLVLLSFIEAVLGGAAIRYVIWDQHLSAIEGSIGAFPRRVLVPAEHWAQAARVLSDAGLAHELVSTSLNTQAEGEPIPTTRRRWPWHRA